MIHTRKLPVLLVFTVCLSAGALHDIWDREVFKSSRYVIGTFPAVFVLSPTFQEQPALWQSLTIASVSLSITRCLLSMPGVFQVWCQEVLFPWQIGVPDALCFHPQ